MNRKPNQPFAVIDFARTPYTCMDVTCPCGGNFHVHGEKDGASSQHIRCPFCKDVLSIGADVNLLGERENFDVNVGLHAYIQWKGSNVIMTAHCKCSQTFEIAKDFAHKCDCPHCGAHYHCESRLEVAKLNAQEAAAIANINEPEKDYEDMDEAERAAYDANMEALAAEERKNRPSSLNGLTPFELGHLVEPGSQLDYARAFDGRVVPGFAYFDGTRRAVVLHELSSSFQFGGARKKGLVIIPDVHVPNPVVMIHGHSHRPGANKQQS